MTLIRDVEDDAKFFDLMSDYRLSSSKWGVSLPDAMGGSVKAKLLQFALGVIDLSVDFLAFINRIKHALHEPEEVPMEAPRAAKTRYVGVGAELTKIKDIASQIAHVCGEGETMCIDSLSVSSLSPSPFTNALSGYRMRDDFEAAKGNIAYNLVVAEVMNRLGNRAVDRETFDALLQLDTSIADEEDVQAGERFSPRIHYKYNGVKVYTVDALAAALVADGHKVEAFTRHYLTSALAMMAKKDVQGGEEPSNLADVPFPIILQRTHYKAWWDFMGTEIKEALVHSELHFSITGPKFHGEFDWYTSNSEWTMFTENTKYHYPAWNGCKIGRRFTGDEGVQALKYAAVFTEAANDVGTFLENGGYGHLGVCNDAVAFITKMLTNEIDIFVLLNRGGYFQRIGTRLGELHAADAALPAAMRLDLDKDIKRLQSVIEGFATDVGTDQSDVWRRMLFSIPFDAKSGAPFDWVAESRKQLEAIVPAKDRIAVGEFCDWSSDPSGSTSRR